MIRLLILVLMYAEWLGCRVEPVYTFSIEFVSGSFTNVSTRLERASWDRAIVDLYSPPTPGQALFELHNGDGAMTPKNNTNLVPGKAVKLTATYGGSTYPLFFGRITDLSFSPILGNRTTLIEAADDWDRIAQLRYNTPLQINVVPSSLFTVLMSDSGVRSFSSDPLASDLIPFAWYQDRDAANALEQLVRSGHYQLLVDGEGTYALRDRFWSSFATAIQTYSIADDLRIRVTRDSVVNRTKISAEPRQQTTDLTTLAYLVQSLSIASGQAVGFWLAYQDPAEPSLTTPVGSIISPVASTDYYATDNALGSGNNVTSQLSLSFRGFAASAVASLYNAGPGTAFLTRFQVRGYPIRRLPRVSGEFDIASSQSQFGLKPLTIEDGLISNVNFLDALARVITVEKHQSRPSAEHTLTNEFPDVLGNDIGDIISIIDSFTGYTLQWQVRGFQHELSLVNGLRHSATFDLETFEAFPFLVLDHSQFGVLNSNRVLAV